MKSLTLLCLFAALLGFMGCATLPPDKPPTVLLRAQPIYPYELKRDGVSGSALVEFVVNSEGIVRDPRVVRTNRDEFGQASCAAILQWKFTPGIKRGRAVNARMQQAFYFSIEDEK